MSQDDSRSKLMMKTEQLAGHVHGAAVSLNEAAQELADLKRRALDGEWIFKGNCPNCTPVLEEVARLRAELATVLAERDGLQSMLTQQGRELARAKAELDDIQEQHERVVAERDRYCEKSIEYLKTTIQHLEMTIEGCNGVTRHISSERDRLEAKSERLGTELADVRSEATVERILNEIGWNSLLTIRQAKIALRAALGIEVKP